MNNKKITLTEIFMAKVGAGWDKCFYGCIRREKDEDGNPQIRGIIDIYSGKIYSVASTQDELGNQLDELATLVVEYEIHKSSGINTKMCDIRFCSN